jgi:filamentous hemagglutinin family protein
MTRDTLFLPNQGICLRLAIMSLAGLLSIMTAPPHISRAQVPPITPSGLNTQISGPITVPGGTQYTITGGMRPGVGPNLFHSFGQFGVPTATIANFLNETALPTANILGRVTGGSNAAADALLSVAPVATFGFLGPRSGPITVDHSTLQMPEGKGLALVGGAISIVGGRLIAKGAPIELTARESIVISGVGQAGPTGVLTSADSAGQRGSVTLAAPTVRLETATVESTAGEIGSAGTITIQGFGGTAAKTVSLENALVRTTISGGSAAQHAGDHHDHGGRGDGRQWDTSDSRHARAGPGRRYHLQYKHINHAAWHQPCGCTRSQP